MKTWVSFILLFIFSVSYAQNLDSTKAQEMSFVFTGDIMGHGPQIKSAYNAVEKTYDYHDVFKYIKDVLSEPDYAIGNLEVTLAGPPFKGYPQFSSPDALAVACQDAGIDILVTSNNHSCDRGGLGITRTIDVLDSLDIIHTGTFKNPEERSKYYPLMIEDDCMRIAILNYTYGTNGLPYPDPTIVNMIDYDLMKTDLEVAKSKNPDKIIVVTHWGSEYKLQPIQRQVDRGKFLFENGADIVVGMHPHVIEKMVWEKRKTEDQKEELIVYSLGNFVSNQRKRYTDGGTLFKMTLRKEGHNTFIKEAGYLLTWVYTPEEYGKKKYYVLPADQYEDQPEFFDNKESYDKMKLFIDDSRKLYGDENVAVPEYVYRNGKWVIND